MDIDALLKSGVHVHSSSLGLVIKQVQNMKILIEIPEFRRACFCVPVRYGIIILGYLNLVYSIFYVGLEVIISYQYAESALLVEVAIHRGVPIPAPLWFVVLLYSADIIFSVMLLIGAHKKICMLLNAFYYYSLSTTLAASACLAMVWFLYHNEFVLKEGYVELAFTFSSFAVHIYLLLLIRSEVKKLRNCNPYSVVNHMTEVVIEQPMGVGRTPL